MNEIVRIYADMIYKHPRIVYHFALISRIFRGMRSFALTVKSIFLLLHNQYKRIFPVKKGCGFYKPAAFLLFNKHLS
jgi:hypothetical protein